jgi:serine protease Do
MRRLKTGATWAAGIAAGIGIGVLAAHVQGQENPPERPREERQARAFALADMFGGRIGVTVREAGPEDTKRERGVSVGTVIVEDVQEDSPAQQAGIKEGDVVMEFDGERVRSVRQFRRLVEETAQGRSAPVVVSRGGQRMDLTVTPESRDFAGMLRGGEMHLGPDSPIVRALPRMRELERITPEIEVFTSGRVRLGVQIEDLTDQLETYFGVTQGVLVTSVEKESAAARGGFQAGDVITAVDGTAVEDGSDLRRRLRRIDDDREFPVEISRDRKAMTLKVRLEPLNTTTRRGITF